MAGILAGIALVANPDADGEWMSGAKLRIYDADTLLPVTAYSDLDLTEEHEWPIVGDATGRIPMFYLADGTYRARLASSDGGFTAFDVAEIPTVGATAAAVVDPDAAVTWETGDVDWQPRSGTRTGWVRHNGRTIGSAGSSATERASADTEDLFTVLWDRHADAICPVLPSRGATAAADFLANKSLTLLDLKSRVAVGLDDMGSTAANRLDGSFLTPTTAGATGGVATIALAAANLGAHTHALSAAGTAVAVADHTHSGTATILGSTGDNGDTGTALVTTALETYVGTTTGFVSPAGGAHSHALSGATDSAGSGTAHNNMQPGMLGTWFVRL